jgi:glycerol-3-phosphate cytidylyltransferase
VNVLEKINNLKRENKVIGFTATTGDLLHAGHIAMLAEAKSYCDYLIVGLLTDPTHDRSDSKNKPIQSVFERWLQLQSVSYVDAVIPFDNEKDLEDMLLTIMPNVRIAGEEYENVEHTGKNIKEIQMIYNKRKHSFSSTELRNRVLKLKDSK